MDNYAIADQFTLLSKLMDIHGENSFKSKSYSSAAFAIEKLPMQLSTVPHDKLFAIKGIGESVGKKVIEILETGELEALQQLIAQTPEGVLDMMNIKGLGPKKLHTLWKEMHISSVEELKEACMQNKIADTKGFGQKTQQNILEAIHFQQQNIGKYLYIQVETFANALQEKLQQKFEAGKLALTGDFKRQMEVIEELEWVTTIDKKDLKNFFEEDAYKIIAESDEWLQLQANEMMNLKFYLTDDNNFFKTLLKTSSSPEFLSAFTMHTGWDENAVYNSEEEIFETAGLAFVPAYLREDAAIITKAKENKLPHVIQASDVKGLIHSHSNWSDGAHSIEEMANELISRGFEYMVISDHSKAAFYANGLSEQRIVEQHKYVDELNKKLAPFKIFKSIECDILNDGEMDYDNTVLSSFDLVIASVHSNLQMNEEKAMQRLLGAINNPYVTILGHMTGRLLAKRKGYPVDHKAIIDACAKNNVVIEINAHPVRLDMDWRYIDYALEKGVMLSINPDAHSFDDFNGIKYGVLVAQKGGLTKESNLSSMSKSEFESFLQNRKKLKGLM